MLSMVDWPGWAAANRFSAPNSTLWRPSFRSALRGDSLGPFQRHHQSPAPPRPKGAEQGFCWSARASRSCNGRISRVVSPQADRIGQIPEERCAWTAVFDALDRFFDGEYGALS